MKKTALFLLLAATLPTACIQDEAPNAEADILAITLPEGVVVESAPDYYRSYDNLLGAYPLSIEVAFGTDLSAISPTFELTPGATLKVIENGDTIDVETVNSKAQNFDTPVRYIVTSELKYSSSVHPNTRKKSRYSVSVHSFFCILTSTLFDVISNSILLIASFIEKDLSVGDLI